MAPMKRFLAALLAAALAAGGLAGCSEAEPQARARRVASRGELIGGPSALGEIGDFVLENDKIRVVIQDGGEKDGKEQFSRGFGVYGGSLIDADRVRPLPEGGLEGQAGRDQFGEMFPIFFLQAMRPDGVEVVADGADGGPAKVRVHGTADDFLSMTKALNQAIINSNDVGTNPLKLLDPQQLGTDDDQIEYEVVYELAPGDRFVKITTRMTNRLPDKELAIPSPLGSTLLRLLQIDTANFRVPLGSVLLFGAGNEVFAPGYGYDVRFALEDSFAAQLPFPALPGLLVPGLVSTSDNGISYGFFALPDPKVESFPNHRVDEDGNNLYEQAYPGVDVDEGSMLLPFLASSFTGVFYAQAPEKLAPRGDAAKPAPEGSFFEYTTYFVVGDGDAASVLDTFYALRGEATGELFGEIRDAQTVSAVEGASIIVYDEKNRPVNQLQADAAGNLGGRLPPGRYTARVVRQPMLSEPTAFTIEAGERTYVAFGAPVPARVAVQITDESGRALPAKVTVVGTVDAAKAGQPLRKFLFDLAAGQHWRTSDVVADEAGDPSTRRYIEAIEFAADGQTMVDVRPGREYEVFVSRGPEYTVQRVVVTPEAGRTTNVASRLERVVDTAGWISGDFHVHAQPSLDAEVPLERRVITGAAEGVEYLVATDHNFVTDYRPYIERLGLEPWVNSMVGIEMTTLESGHFNGFPVRRDVGEVTKGSFEWSLQTPQTIFDAIRAQGYGRGETVVQVNHPRDSIMGYFSQYELDALDAVVKPKTATAGLDFGKVIDPSGPAFYRLKTNADGVAIDDKGAPVVDVATGELLPGKKFFYDSTFSDDFDAIEILNGGMPVAQIHHTRMPASLDGLDLPEEFAETLPEAGAILCDEDDLVAFPGAVDDWFNLLNHPRAYSRIDPATGEPAPRRPYVAVGNSDSHHDDDIGYPRTYVRVGTDDPAKLDERTVARALLEGRAVLTNGPFVELFVGDAQIGDQVKANGQIEVRVVVRAAPWIDVRRATLYANGEAVERFTVKLEDGVFEWKKSRPVARDTWFVVEVEGDRSLFPVVKPVDIPPFLLNDAFSQLAGPLNLGGGPLTALEPPRVGYFEPFAITNPIWVDADGTDGFTPPGVPARQCRKMGVEAVEPSMEVARDGLREAPAAGLMSPRRFKPSFGGFPRIKGDVRDVRAIFDHFSSHAH